MTKPGPGVQLALAQILPWFALEALYDISNAPRKDQISVPRFRFKIRHFVGSSQVRDDVVNIHFGNWQGSLVSILIVSVAFCMYAKTYAHGSLLWHCMVVRGVGG